MIPISVVDLGPEVEQQVLEVLRSGIIAQGPKVAELEARFAELVGVQHAVAVNNGTTALVAALQVLDLRPGDEVVTSPFTFIATLNAILEAGATARFADISVDDFNLDPATVAAAVTDRTRVLMPVHLYGQTADMGKLAPLAAEHGLHLVEDAAQAHGARHEGRGAGSFGIGCFSFYATKNLTTGEGGMITTDDAELAGRLRVLRNQGMRQRYQYEMAGHNYRLTDLQAAVALPALSRYEEQVARRRANAAALSARLGESPALRVPAALPGRDHVWHQYTVLVTEESAVSRDELAAALTERGIGNGIYYPKTVYDYECYAAHPRVVVSGTPVATDVASRCLSLPVHAKLTDDEVQQVADAVLAVVSK
ncbi:MAG TPA: DegT/DnrJ/EryC1/StrS family aminotransferase [Pseudonocardiaceae bacterium]